MSRHRSRPVLRARRDVRVSPAGLQTLRNGDRKPRRARKPIPAETRRREGDRGRRGIGDPVLSGPRVQATGAVEALSACRERGVQTGATLYPYELLPAVPEHIALSDELDDSQAATEIWYEVA